ncbi:hypothetical protein ONS95_009575 [Cadophora gregata]|uniref:uncharacterized protein n=1 Tax=Cadophora gregata TaxID=51156 RepID=UPI0026DD9919|nr:uncharacterized protein ONS95_009575 [Cadophora gregata]KAK0124628.1 hypothetical protein ONS95_009575 [Cadophora gregata]
MEMEMEMDVGEVSSLALTAEGEGEGEGESEDQVVEGAEGDSTGFEGSLGRAVELGGSPGVGGELRDENEGKDEEVGKDQVQNQRRVQKGSERGSGGSEGDVDGVDEGGNVGVEDEEGEKGGDETSEASKDPEIEKNEKIELPVLKNTGKVYDEEESRHQKKVLRSEIPDSEADTEEALSPVKGSVDNKLRESEADEKDLSKNADLTGGVLAGHSQERSVGTDNTPQSLEVDNIPSQSNEQIIPETGTLRTNPVHQDSSGVSFVDDETMIIFPKLTTSDLQPTHTPTQTQTQPQEEEVINSHFADAVAVMSDVGGGTQDTTSSLGEEPGKGTEVVTDLPGEVRDETQAGDMGLVGEVVALHEATAMDVELLGSQPSEDSPSEKAVQVPVRPASSSEQYTVQDTGSADQLPDAQKERDSSVVREDEDIVMSEHSLPDQQTETRDDVIQQAKEDEAKDIGTQSTASGAIATTTIRSRSIPDSDDDDEDLTVADSVLKAKDQAKSHSEASSVIQAPTESNKAGEKVTNHPSPPQTMTYKSSRPRKTPRSPFKAPAMSTATKSQSTEPTSSPLKREGTLSIPITKAKDTEREKAPPESSTVSDAAQSKDVLMAELKAMKIASIQARNAWLEAEIKKKKARLEEVTKELRYPAAETVKNHIKLLHDYNDIRDIGQGLVGMIADNRGVRIGELYEEFGVGLKD